MRPSFVATGLTAGAGPPGAGGGAPRAVGEGVALEQAGTLEAVEVRADDDGRAEGLGHLADAPALGGFRDVAGEVRIDVDGEAGAAAAAIDVGNAVGEDGRDGVALGLAGPQ